jgi:hypothetical protein
MKKYEIIKRSLDEYTLKYKDKEINFKTDIDIIAKMQRANKRARIKMITDLSKEGVSLKDFTIEEKKNGKTYQDNTNKTELEKAYIEEETANVFNEICKDKLGYDLFGIIQEIELNEEEITEFSKELAEALTGKTPRGE